MVEQLIILGSGPAGLTAAIYAARANLEPLIIEGADPGGQLMITTEVENYPGFPKGTRGPQFMADVRDQAARFGTRFVIGAAEGVDFSKKPFVINAGGKRYECKTVVIATGATAKWLGLESERKLRGKGVSACAVCDGFFFKNQRVVVIGGGDTAMEEALFLTKFAREVTVVHRRNELRASKIMQKRAKENPKISFQWNKVVDDILDVKAGKVSAVSLKDVKSGKVSQLECEGVFMGIGYTPNTEIFKGEIDMDEKGYIVTKKITTETSVPGVFAAGDAQDSSYRQAATAVGTGCMAAMDAERYLNVA